MNKITPGPWFQHGIDVHAGDGLGAVTYASPTRSIRQNEANAKAIAAVPDLIDACREGLSIAESFNVPSIADVIREALRKAGVEP